jgi:hypothetical protein
LGRGMEGVPWSDVAIDPVAVNRELWRKLGDDEVRKAAYRGG